MKLLTSTFFTLLLGFAGSSYGQTVEYCEDSILESEDNAIRLLGGSKWEVASYGYFMILQDVIIIHDSIKSDGGASSNSEIISGGSRSIVTPVSGSCASQTGEKARVVREINDGATLFLDSGELLNFDSFDSFDTGFWLPPYEVLITSGGLYMWNLDKGKRVWIKSIE
jgi:hypothetical protein